MRHILSFLAFLLPPRRQYSISMDALRQGQEERPFSMSMDELRAKPFSMTMEELRGNVRSSRI
jgi:hypothetical protein